VSEWDLSPKPVSTSQVTLVQLMEITDANLGGLVHGGVIMKLVDDAAGLAAIRHSRGPVVTAAVDEMSFIEPVQLGSLVTVKASLTYVGSTSMEVGVRVETEDVVTGARAHTSSAYLVFVALDENTGRPREVPGLIAETPDEKRRLREAEIRREARLARRQRILEARAAGHDVA
jgi:acyl-CoA hydrolase